MDKRRPTIDELEKILQNPDAPKFTISPDGSVSDLSGDFAFALHRLKEGKRVRRAGWNGKGMFVFLVQGSTFKVNRAPLNQFYPDGTEIRYHAHVDMKTADGMVVPWLCSQTDMLAEDWELAE